MKMGRRGGPVWGEVRGGTQGGTLSVGVVEAVGAEIRWYFLVHTLAKPVWSRGFFLVHTAQARVEPGDQRLAARRATSALETMPAVISALTQDLESFEPLVRKHWRTSELPGA